MQGEVLTVKEAAELLQVCDRTVYTWAHRQDFPVLRIGTVIRIPKNLLLAWVENQAKIGV